MITYIIIAFLVLVSFFIFYHFRYGVPEELAGLRIALKNFILVLFWIFFAYLNFLNLWNNSYSGIKKNKTQKIYLQQESGSEFEYFTIFLRNKSLIHQTNKPFYNWQVYYSSRYYDVLPEFRYRSSFLDTLELRYDSTNYDRFMIVTNRDSVFAGSIALEFQENPILIFSSDLQSIKLNKINKSFSYEISLIVLFITSVLAALYHIIKIKTRGMKTVYKFLFFIIIISWAGVNIYQISKPILEFYFNLA